MSDSPTASVTATASPSATPVGATLNGPIDSTAAPATVIFSGTGRPGDLIQITTGAVPAPLGAPGIVAANGTFAISVFCSLSSGQLLEAHAGGTTGPSNNTITVSAAFASPAAPMSTTVSAGATIITVSGTPGDTVSIVLPGSAPPLLLGTAVIPASGQVGVVLSQPLPPSTVFDIVDGGTVVGSGTSPALADPPPSVSVGTVLDGSSVITGTGVPGATIQAVDDQGNILGSTTVDAQGNFSLPISGANAGHTVTIIQNGVKAIPPLPILNLGAAKAFTNLNVFNPEKGGVLTVGFRAEADGQVTVKVYNIAGDLVRPVFEASVIKGMQYQANWNGKNNDGENVASGVYFVSVKGGGIRAIRKVIILK